MPAATLHNAPNPIIAKGLIRAERAFLHGTFEFAFESFDQPVYFQVYTRVHQRVEMAGAVFEGQGIWVG